MHLKVVALKHVYRFRKAFEYKVIEKGEKREEAVAINFDLYIHFDTNSFHIDATEAMNPDAPLFQFPTEPGTFCHPDFNKSIPADLFYDTMGDICRFAYSCLNSKSAFDLEAAVRKNQVIDSYSK